MTHTIKSAMPILHTLLAANEPVFLRGTYGLGKSSLPYQLAADESWKRENRFPECAMHEWPIFDWRAILIDPVEARGIPSIENGMTRWNAPDFLPQESRDGAYGILALDELNARGVDPGVQSLLLQLTLERRIGEYKLPPEWRIMAMGNRPGLDKSGATELTHALADRFWQLDLEPDLESWIIWADSNDIRPEVIAFIRWMDSRGESVLHNGDASPRSWAKVSKVLGYVADPLEAFPLVASKVGNGNAAEFIGFIRIYKELPRLADIYQDPDSAKVPTESSALYAVSSTLARAAKVQTLDSIVRYLNRIAQQSGGSDFAAMAMASAIRRDPTLKGSPAFTAWSLANPDVSF